MYKPVHHTIKFKYAMCSCKVPPERLKTNKSIKENCKCGIKQINQTK